MFSRWHGQAFPPPKKEKQSFDGSPSVSVLNVSVSQVVHALAAPEKPASHAHWSLPAAATLFEGHARHALMLGHARHALMLVA